MNEPIPTKRFVLDPSWVCNILCRFCYNIHSRETWKDTVKPFDEVKSIINAGKSRGNDYVDITGGEPTIYPDIVKIIRYALSQDIKSCIITNGIVNKKTTEKLIEAGVDDFLVSRHGLEQTHNEVTNYDKAYSHQLKFLDQISKVMWFRFNCVITWQNQRELPQIAEEMLRYPVKIVNFINFNPHREWADNKNEASKFIANLKYAELEPAIDILESAGVMVNVRYFPMCLLRAPYRRCICNDLHVCFDPYEWDYQIEPKTFETHRQWGVETSMTVEEKGDPCCNCGLQWICGGINKAYHEVSTHLFGEICKPEYFHGDQDDFYYYRKDQKLSEAV